MDVGLTLYTLVVSIVVPALLTAVLVTRRTRQQLRELAAELELSRRKAYETEGRHSAGTSSSSDPAGATPLRQPGKPDEDLIRATNRGELIIFAGQGLSAIAGGYDIASVMHRTIVKLAQVDPEKWSDISERASRREILGPVTDIVESRAESDDLAWAVRTALSELEATSESALLETISNLPLAGVLTTAWDDQLADHLAAVKRVREMGPRSGRRFIEAFSEREDRVDLVRLLGTPDLDLVFTIQRLADLIVRDPDLERLLRSVFSSHTVLFLGVSMNTISEVCRAAGIRAGDRQHWALVPPGPRALDDLEVESFQLRFGIEVLPASDITIEPFISRLSSAVRHSRDSIELDAPRDRTLLRRLELNNIGGFESFVLNFHPGWNVLLGDNGSGKTTILRAISLALAGSLADDDASAGRLLNWQEPEGSVRLELGDRTLEAVLMRTGSGARTRTRQVSPVETGELVALGVPAQRGVSTRRMRGPTAAESLTGGQSLLPLLSSNVDFRLDDVKQWIVNTWAANSGPNDVLLLYFEIIDRAVPGPKLRLAYVDTDTWDVLVYVGNQIVPLAVVSQGMASVLAWVGLLVQRLSTTDASGPLTERQAIVLVDELDAHLHPAWQRTLVPMLRETFPNVQFVVTTHSPLIAADLTTGELHVLSGMTPPETETVDSLRGLPVDDILVSEAFGLANRLDVTTTRRSERFDQLAAQTETTREEDEEMAQLERAINGRQTPLLPAERRLRREEQIAEALQRRDYLSRFRSLSSESQQEILQALGEAEEPGEGMNAEGFD